MGQHFEGHLVGENLKIGLVVSRFNEFITQKLLAGAQDALLRHGVSKDNIDVAWAPGAFELPLAVKALAQRGDYDAIIALGCIIRGATAHFDYVAGEVSKGISRLNLELNLPVIFGVLTTETIEQAIERAGTKAGNKGWEAAQSAIEMANLLKQINR